MESQQGPFLLCETAAIPLQCEGCKDPREDKLLLQQHVSS